MPPLAGRPPADDEPIGHSYGAVFVSGSAADVAAVMDRLRGIRFSGWLAAPDLGWIVILGRPGDGVVADGRRGIIEVGAMLAEPVPAGESPASPAGAATARPVIAVRVRRDRQLALVAWSEGRERVRFCSDPSQEAPPDPEVLDDPIGAGDAGILAELVERADAANPLLELLDESLDPDSTFESERLARVLRLLGLPTWVVASGALPHDIPTGPRARELVRLSLGRPGVPGRIADLAVSRVRRRRTSPPVIADPPRSSGNGFEYWGI